MGSFLLSEVRHSVFVFHSVAIVRYSVCGSLDFSMLFQTYSSLCVFLEKLLLRLDLLCKRTTAWYMLFALWAMQGAFARIWAICTALVPAAATFKGSGNFGRLGQVIRSRKKGECLGRGYPISGPFIALYFLFTRRGAASLQQAPASIMFCSRAWNSLKPWTRINSPSYNLLIVDIVSQCCKT